MSFAFRNVHSPKRCASRFTPSGVVARITLVVIMALQACGDSPPEPKKDDPPIVLPQLGSIVVSPATLTMVPFAGLDTVTFAVTAYNQHGQQMSPGGPPTFAVLDPSVVQVGGDGKVTAHALGTTTVTVTWTAGAVTQTASVPVTVLDNVEAAVVGTWQGPINGSWPNGLQQTSTMTTTLNADGTASSQGLGGSLFACATAGTWAVTTAEVTGIAQEVACQGTVISFKAPLSTTRLIGTWSASSGATGAFSYTKK